MGFIALSSFFVMCEKQRSSKALVNKVCDEVFFYWKSLIGCTKPYFSSQRFARHQNKCLNWWIREEKA